MSKFFLRIIIDILIIITIIQTWWFIALPLGIFGLWKYFNYIEIIIAGIIFDSIYGLSDQINYINYLGTITSIALFSLMVIFKRVVRK